MSRHSGRLLERLRSDEEFSRQIVHVEEVAGREAAYQATAQPLAPAVQAVLDGMGIQQLYTHQAQAIDHARAGRDVVVVTGTASGKTLCYTVPTADAIAADPNATMLALYPTKALTQDQLRAIGPFASPSVGRGFQAATYDGDTPANVRRKARDAANVILTNPDMLHMGILPNHARWHRFLSNLRYVVIDEVHAYRGVFGSHVANVVRRLLRICEHYGAHPQFICSSATMANPGEHAGHITGREIAVVDQDGAPRGARRFVLWNPPLIDGAVQGNMGWRAGGDRRSARTEAVSILCALVQENVQTIAFVRTRLAAETIMRDARERLGRRSARLAASVEAYRSGYLPEERRAIEGRLVERRTMAIASTNALELGIDIGSLDACLMVGYPGTISSMLQQSGRAGRSQGEALVVLIAQNAPVDQYLMTRPEYLFGRNPEQAVIDPDNPYIVNDHLRCAIQELPLGRDEAATFGGYAGQVLDLIEEDGVIKLLPEGRYYWASVSFPAAEVSLRTIDATIYTIQDDTAGARVVGTMDETSAFAQLHPHAVYLHAGETYFVEQLDLEQKIAHVERRDLDYYTQAIQMSRILIQEQVEQRPGPGRSCGYGDVTVTTSLPMFKKVRFHSRDSLGFEPLELPAKDLDTVAMWMCPDPEAGQALAAQGQLVGEGLLGVANLFLELSSMFAMCDPSDVGATIDSAPLGHDALFLFDKYPGGVGYARRCLDRLDDMLPAALSVVRQCACKDGCPSCVGAATPAWAQTDIDSTTRGRVADKAATIALLEHLCSDKRAGQ